MIHLYTWRGINYSLCFNPFCLIEYSQWWGCLEFILNIVNDCVYNINLFVKYSLTDASLSIKFQPTPYTPVRQMDNNQVN